MVPGPGRDRIDFDGAPDNNYTENIAFGGKLLIEDRSGPLTVTGTYVNVRREAVITTGNSIDHISLYNSRFRRSLLIDARRGPNTIDLSHSYLSEQPILVKGDDDDTVAGLTVG